MSEEKLPDVYWLTRDKLGGELMDVVHVWAVEPYRQDFGHGDCIWRAPRELEDVAGAKTCIDDWSVAEARRRVGPGVPDTERECTRVGTAS